MGSQLGRVAVSLVPSLAIMLLVTSCAASRSVLVDASVPATPTTVWEGEVPQSTKPTLWMGFDAYGPQSLERIHDTFQNEFAYELRPNYEFQGVVTVTIAGEVVCSKPIRISSDLLFRQGFQDERTVDVASEGEHQAAMFKLTSLRSANPGDAVEVVAQIDLSDGQGALENLRFQIRGQ